MSENRASVTADDVIAAVPCEGVLVGALIFSVAEKAQVEPEFVTSAMWDAVEDGRLSYGADAIVRLAQ